jgi:hypothetical protein
MPALIEANRNRLFAICRLRGMGIGPRVKPASVRIVSGGIADSLS